MLARTQPARSVTRARAGPASDRRPVVVGDELLGLGGELGEVGLERVVVVRLGRRARGRRPGRPPVRRGPSRRHRRSRLRPCRVTALVGYCLRVARRHDLDRGTPMTMPMTRSGRPGSNRATPDPVVPDDRANACMARVQAGARSGNSRASGYSGGPGAAGRASGAGPASPAPSESTMRWRSASGTWSRHLLRDDDAQLGLEVEDLETRAAVVEVGADARPPVVGQLTVEERVELVQRLVAVAVVVARDRRGRWSSCASCQLTRLGRLVSRTGVVGSDRRRTGSSDGHRLGSGGMSPSSRSVAGAR